MNIDVVISGRNRGKQLMNCLNSIAAGEILPQQIVIVDDRSDDDETLRLLYKIYLRGEIGGIQIKIIHRRGEGGWRNPAIPKNMAIRNTRADAELLWFLEPEGLVFPDTLRLLLAHFDQEKKIWVNATHQGFVTQDVTKEQVADPEWVWRQPFTYIDPKPHLAVRCALVPREAAFAIRGYDEWFNGGIADEEGRIAYGGPGHDDTDFGDRLHRAGWRAINDFNIRTLHQYHERSPLDQYQVDEVNVKHMQMNQRKGVVTVNSEEKWSQFKD